MTHLRRLGSEIRISIPADNDGLTGRECPAPNCLGYFKIQLGTGLTGPGLPCHCPYCGHVGGHDTFWTQEQIEYAKSVALNQITGALIKDLKALEFDHRPPSGSLFGIGMSLKVKGRPSPIHHYREKQLETEVICDNCALRYAVYGVFAFCPDCGAHNSLQILRKNVELVEKEITLAATVEPDLSAHLIGDALENAVSAFDGFGREVCRVWASRSCDPVKAEALSFQNIEGARKSVQDFFGFNFAAGLTADQWELGVRCFQKRHLLAHKMGVVDRRYKKLANDPYAVVGRKVSIASDDVAALCEIVKSMGARLLAELSK